jgi:small subunit ribosomal protein S3
MRIRELVAKQLSNASVSQVEIERGINHVTVTVHTAKPGIVIGKGGANVEALRTNVGKLTNKKVKLEIKEILQPELDGMLLAQNVAGQLERRIAFRKAIKQSIQRTIKAGAKGVKIQVSGRLGGSEMSRTEWDKEGRIPLGTLRADISYGVVHAHTTYGRIGVKAWVYRGEQLGDRPGSARTEPRAARRPAAGARPRNGASAPAAAAPRGRAPRAAEPVRAEAEAAPATEEQRTVAAPQAVEVTTPEATTPQADPTVATTEAPAAEAVATPVEVAEAPGEAATAAAEAPTADTSDAPAAPTAPDTEPVAARAPTVGVGDEPKADAAGTADKVDKVDKAEKVAKADKADKTDAKPAKAEPKKSRASKAAKAEES